MNIYIQIRSAAAHYFRFAAIKILHITTPTKSLLFPKPLSPLSPPFKHIVQLNWVLF